jgi:hypothetical protein
MRDLIFPILLALIAAGWALAPAHADTLRERCARITNDNAEYKNCIADATNEETGFFKEKACSENSCIYKLACVKEKSGSICRGTGFTVTYRSANNGRDISIQDPSGKITKMFQCGTCSWLDYESGPLKNAEIRLAGSNIILEVPK